MNPSGETPFDYSGPDELRSPILATLEQVVDPELAMSIIDVGLVYAVHVAADAVDVTMTITSAACPVADVIIDDVCSGLERILPTGFAARVELAWEPAWTPERLSPRAKKFMGW